MKTFERIAPAQVEDPLFIPHSDDQAPSRPYLKDLIFSGEFKHPVQGFTLKMDAKRMDGLVDNFYKMKANGIRVPIFTTHKGDQMLSDVYARGGAALPKIASLITLGYVGDMARGGTPLGATIENRRTGEDKKLDPDRLYCTCDFSDAECEGIAKRVKQVSIQINPKYKDSKGNEYGETIEHIAVTPEPIVPNQKDFEALKFSLSCELTEGGGVEYIVQLANEGKSGKEIQMASQEKKEGEDKDIDHKAILSKAFSMCKEALTSHLGAEHDDVKGLKPENAVPTMCKHFSALKDAHEKLNAAHVANAKLAASREIPAPVLSMVAKAGKTELDSLASAGCITAKVRDGLVNLLVGPANARNVLALSCEEGSEDNLVSKVAAILKDNTPVALGEKTGPQVQSLSREVPGQTGPSAEQKKEDEEFLKRREARIGKKK
jgi:hypothetical protein